MLFRLTNRLAILVSCFGLASGAYGAIAYDESVSGDLSNSGLTPTVVVLSAGSNQVLGTTGQSGGPTDRDYFTVTVPSGLELASLFVLSGTEVGGSVSFIGLQAGTQVTVSPNASNAVGLLGWAHYDETN